MDNGEGDGHLELDEDQVKRLRGDIGICNEAQLERAQPTYYLPLEVWNIALCKIDDPQDILRCCDVCGDWESLLHDKMVSAYHQLILPKLLRFLGRNDLLNCSAVSKNWNKWIDASVMNIRETSKIWDNVLGFERMPLPVLSLIEGICRNVIGMRADISPFLEAKQQFAGNQFDSPLAYQQVRIYYYIDQETNNPTFDIFCQRLVRFLQRFGRYIYHLEFVSVSNLLLELIQMIAICLDHTPNLKVFRCKFWQSRWGPMEDEHLVDEYMAAAPFPNSTIQKLRMDDCSMKLREVVLERYGNQLVYLHNFVEFPALALELIPKGVTFQNLKLIQGRVVASTEANDGSSYLNSITQLIPVLTCTLVGVDIIIDGTFNYLMLKLSFDNFLKALEKYQPQIEILRLSLSPNTVQFNPPASGGLTGLVSLPPPLVTLELVTMPSLKRLTLDQSVSPRFKFSKSRLQFWNV